MRDLLIIAPTRGRREGAERLIKAVAATATADTHLILAVDDDDHSYDGLRLDVQIIRGPRQDVAGWTNTIAVPLAKYYRAIASICDDHVPRTHGWDTRLLDALGGRPGVAYGNDLWQRERAATAVVISSPVVAALGYMAPPGVEHLCIDLFWVRLGDDLGCREYLDDVIIEHLHPHAGKAAWDDSYARSNSPAQYARDQAAYEAFLRDQWPGDLDRLREKLAAMTSKEAYDLLCKAERDADPPWWNQVTTHWVMNLEWYKAIRRAFLPDDADDNARDEAKWVPDNGDMVLFRYITVTEDGGAPHLEKTR